MADQLMVELGHMVCRADPGSERRTTLVSAMGRIVRLGIELESAREALKDIREVAEATKHSYEYFPMTQPQHVGIFRIREILARASLTGGE